MSKVMIYLTVIMSPTGNTSPAVIMGPRVTARSGGGPAAGHPPGAEDIQPDGRGHPWELL